MEMKEIAPYLLSWRVSGFYIFKFMTTMLQICHNFMCSEGSKALQTFKNMGLISPGILSHLSAESTVKMCRSRTLECEYFLISLNFEEIKFIFSNNQCQMTQ